MTDRLYYTDATLIAFDARVVRVDDSRIRVVLDRSAFYPTSGGQPHDTGTLHGLRVVDVMEDGTDVVHLLDAPLPADVEQLHGEVDEPRRTDHRQQHSGQHLLSALLHDRFGWPTVSVHFGESSCTVDVTAEQIDADTLVEVERLANAHIAEQRAIGVSFEDAATATGLRKPTGRTGSIRIVTIEGLDRNACGGTHVGHTGEIGPLFVRRAERVRGGTRVEFVCGTRALDRARGEWALLQQLATSCTAAPHDLPVMVAKLQQDAKEQEKERARLEQALAGHEAAACHADARPDSSGRRFVMERLDGAPVASRQLFARAFAQHPNAVFVAVSTSPPALLLASSEDSGVVCGSTVRDALKAVGGRGGGGPRLAQGSAPSPEAAIEAGESLRAALTLEMPIPRPPADEHPSYAAIYIDAASESLTAHGLSSLTELLRRQPGDLAALLRDVPEAAGHSRYAPGKWTLLESLVHTIDSERVFAYRLMRAARGDRTPIAGFEQDDWVPLSGADRRTLPDVITEFGAVRAATLALLAPLDQNMLARRTIASDQETSARALAWMIAGHAAHHLRLTRERYLAK